MKLTLLTEVTPYPEPAAYRRLCVETIHLLSMKNKNLPAAFRRLCVETNSSVAAVHIEKPAAFRRLCVETDE